MKKQWPYFILVLALPTLLVLWWWGLFASAKIETATRGPYRYAYLEARGVYSKLAAKQEEARFLLQQQSIPTHGEATLMMRDPRSTPNDQRSARTGFLIDPEATPHAPLLWETLPSRAVLVAEVRAHPLFAYGKAYGALLRYTQAHGMTLRMPTFERYDHSVLTVEMPLEEQP